MFIHIIKKKKNCYRNTETKEYIQYSEICNDLLKFFDRKDNLKKKNNDILSLKIPPSKKNKRKICYDEYYEEYNNNINKTRKKISKQIHQVEDNNNSDYIGSFLLDFVQQKLDKCDNLSERDRDLFLKLSNHYDMKNKNVK